MAVNGGVGTGAHAGFFTNRGDVKVRKGQVLGFKAGSGYYAKGLTPTADKVRKPPPSVSDQVNHLLAPQYGVLNTQEAQREAALKQFSTALLSQLKGYPAQVANDYQSAQNSINGYAQTAANGLAAANPNGQNQALLDAIGAPQAQKDALAAQNQNVFSGGGAVLYDTRGAIPASQTAADQAAALGYARSLPSIQALASLQGMRGFQTQNALAKQQLAAQAPDLEMKIQAAQQDAFYKQQALNQNAAALGLKTQQQSFENKVTLTKLDTQQRQFVKRMNTQIVEFNLRQKAGQQKLALPNPSLSGKVGYLVDSTGAPITRKGKMVLLPGSRIVNGRVVKSGGSKSKAPRLSALQVQRFKGDAETIASNGKNGFDGKDPVTGQPKHYPPIGFSQAWEEMRKHGIPESLALAALRRIYGVQDNGVAIGADVNPATNPNALGPPAP